MAGVPIKLTIYNEESEVEKELSTAFVPWGIMKRAVKLAKALRGLVGKSEIEILEALGEDDIDTLTQLVVDLYGGRVTLEELETGAEIPEMIAVLEAVVSKAFGAAQNPTPPGNQKPRSRRK